MSQPKRSAKHWDSELALNYSGILVTALVGALGVYSIAGSPLFTLAAILAASQFLLFTFNARLSDYAPWQVLFWLEALCITALLFLVPSSFIIILTVVWLVQAVEYYGVRKAIWFLVASLALFSLAQLLHFGTDNLFNIVVSAALYGLLQLFAVSVIQRFFTERELREETAALNRELIATRELLSQSSAQGERLRIARDLHDIMGHHMTALILNLEVASHTVQSPAKDKVEQSLALAKLLLGDLRSTVSELREETAIDLEKSIHKLVAGIPSLSIDVDFTSAPAIDDVDLAETLLRCTQEAVTNVLRHSEANHCSIRLSGNDDACTLSISDNGQSQAAIEPGNGLRGMLERVTERGGELEWQQTDAGFQLKVTMKTALLS